MKKIIVVALVCLGALGVSGCVIVPGVENKNLLGPNGQVMGEMHAQSSGINGVLVTLYPGLTDAIRNLHDKKVSLPDAARLDNPRNGAIWTCGGPKTDVCSLRYLSTFDRTAEWIRATDDSEGGDFHSALRDMPHPGFDCLAVQIYARIPGFHDDENWTWRHKSDSSCHS